MFLVTNSAFALIQNTPFYIHKNNIESEMQSNQSQHFEVMADGQLARLEEHGFGFENTIGDFVESGLDKDKRLKTDQVNAKYFFARKPGEIQGFRNNVSFAFRVPLKLAKLEQGSQYDFGYSCSVALLVGYRVLLAISKISNIEKYPIASRYFSYIGYNIYCPLGVIETVDVSYNKEDDSALCTVNGVELEWARERLPSRMDQSSSTLRIDINTDTKGSTLG